MKHPSLIHISNNQHNSNIDFRHKIINLSNDFKQQVQKSLNLIKDFQLNPKNKQCLRNLLWISLVVFKTELLKDQWLDRSEQQLLQDTQMKTHQMNLFLMMMISLLLRKKTQSKRSKSEYSLKKNKKCDEKNLSKEKLRNNSNKISYDHQISLILFRLFRESHSQKLLNNLPLKLKFLSLGSPLILKIQILQSNHSLLSLQITNSILIDFMKSMNE